MPDPDAGTYESHSDCLQMECVVFGLPVHISSRRAFLSWISNLENTPHWSDVLTISCNIRVAQTSGSHRLLQHASHPCETEREIGDPHPLIASRTGAANAKTRCRPSDTTYQLLKFKRLYIIRGNWG